MLSEMDNLLLYLALLTVGPYSLVVGAVLLTVPLYVDRSNVRSVCSVVFIIDTTHRAVGCLLRSQGKLDDADYRELVSRLSTSLAMVEAAYMEARRRG